MGLGHPSQTRRRPGADPVHPSSDELCRFYRHSHASLWADLYIPAPGFHVFDLYSQARQSLVCLRAISGERSGQGAKLYPRLVTGQKSTSG